MHKPEILSPAGTMEKLRFALAYGADAVYCSGKNFGLRAYAGNFTDAELEQAVKETHAAGKKIYVTVNSFSRNGELNAVSKHLAYLQEIKADAAIISDLGVLSCAKKSAPKLPVHVSVQANTVNYMTVEQWRGLGAKRVVLARELSFDEIKEIRQRVKDVELEIFVHGAMCMSYSGRCVLSNYLTGRDANRGECTQPCRWSYRLEEEKRPGEYMDVTEDEKGTYIFNSKDLCCATFLEKFMEIGIDSFKIEGRMKSAHYAAVTSAVYSRIRDDYYSAPAKYSFDPRLMAELEKVSHREYFSGFYFPQGGTRQNTKTSDYMSESRMLAVAEKGAGKEGLSVDVKGSFKVGDTVEIFSPGAKSAAAEVKSLINSEGAQEVYAKQDKKYTVVFTGTIDVPEFSIIRTVER